MASIKNLKSQGKAHEQSCDYEYRKRQYVSLPAAKMVRPLRALRQRAAESFDSLRRALVAAGGDETSPVVAEARADFMFQRTLVAVARKLADRGQGAQVHNFAVRHIYG